VVLFEPERTQFDLSWRMFGIHVRVHPLFWLVACLLGADWLQQGGVGYLALWVGCMFVSILVHELGHVCMGRAFGTSSHIVLYGLGGLAIGSSDQPRRWQRIAVSFAGPLAGFLLLGAVLGVRMLVFPPREDGLPYMSYDMPEGMWLLYLGFRMLVWMNLFWGILNLLPIYPLDGGQISREVFTGVSPSNGLRIALGLSFLLSALLAVHCLLAANGRPLLPFVPFGDMFGAIFFGMFAIENLMMLQQAGARQRRPWDEDEWPSGRR
jgi:membrane-associated protease RseP (regulator of RpoE activity)